MTRFLFVILSYGAYNCQVQTKFGNRFKPVLERNFACLGAFQRQEQIQPQVIKHTGNAPKTNNYMYTEFKCECKQPISTTYIFLKLIRKVVSIL